MSLCVGGGRGAGDGDGGERREGVHHVLRQTANVHHNTEMPNS